MVSQRRSRNASALVLLCLALLLAIAAIGQAALQAKPAPTAPAKVEPAKAASPQGFLFIIGGGEREEPMMKRYIALADRFQSGKIVVYTMASGVPSESGTGMVDELKGLGAKAVVWENLTHEQALVEDNAKVLNDAGGVYFTGGDQARLTAALLDTPVLAKIKDLYRKGAVVGGTSAGAAVMSELMITGDEASKPGGEDIECDKWRIIEAGDVLTSRGFGFLTTAVIDQHHIVRKRENRLFAVIGEHPDLLGVAIDEDTAIVVAPDQTFEVTGVSYVLVLDASRAKTRILPTKQIVIENMGLSLLTPGMRYDLKTRAVIR
jgi:cyanophycinase